VERRFGDAVRVLYHDTAKNEVRTDHAGIVTRIQDESLIYPVTVVDGEPVCDGAVSHAVILRAIQTRLEHSGAAQ
jgi:disulfide oxidoreductase YuzD